MRVAICDDDEECRGRIAEFLYPYIQQGAVTGCNEFENGDTLLNAYSKQAFDIIFLDIEMPGLNGVETAKVMREQGKNSIIIFTTSHVSYVSDTFRVGAFQFLVKPIQKEDFDKDFERAHAQHKISRFIFNIYYKGKIAAFNIGEIVFIEGYNKRLSLFTNSDQYEYLGKLSDEEEKLTSYNFLRCHQGFLVNMDYIKLIQKNSILLKNNTEIPVSKHKKTEVLSRFNNYLLRFSV